MLILGIDTAAAPCCAAIYDSEKDIVLAQTVINNKLTHSVTLMPIVEDIIKNSGIALSDIDLFAVSAGPGSFTGVRIGAATVRAFCDALGKPAVAVTSLEALYNNVSSFDGVVVALVFARENECYAQAFSDGEALFSPVVMTVREIIEFSKELDRREKEAATKRDQEFALSRLQEEADTEFQTRNLLKYFKTPRF